MKGSKDRGKNEEAKSEFEEKVLFINRCSKVVKGGRKFSFSALVVVGNGKGSLGVGFAKANEVSDAIRKAGESARKQVEKFEITGTSIAHDVMAKADGALVLLKAAPTGTGVIAGSHVRSILELIGFSDIVAKNIGSNNPNNQVRATVMALKQLQNKKEMLALRSAS